MAHIQPRKCLVGHGGCAVSTLQHGARSCISAICASLKIYIMNCEYIIQINCPMSAVFPMPGVLWGICSARFCRERNDLGQDHKVNKNIYHYHIYQVPGTWYTILKSLPREATAPPRGERLCNGETNKIKPNPPKSRDTGVGNTPRRPTG